MQEYIKEAERVLDEEIRLFKSGTYAEVRPAPSPIFIAPEELKSFIDNIYASSVVSHN